ncbi:type II secretory pathway pseudopilin PulG [Silvimonas terrae]|uniref:Type II secretory pathway pseudopilin PulG n=1 Tax=Silvimonas terrae TaxID=300266 RepID=A0A840RIL4_9NEIS|nr:type II secretory pathway pseudopilin PulG [Silvimonas terrae]
MIEGLIAMLLVGIVGVGLTYVLSRSALSQTTVNAQNIVVNNVRSQLMQSAGGMRNLCASTVTQPPIPLAGSTSTTATLTISCGSSTPATVAVGSTSQTVYVPRFSTTATDTSGVLGGSLTLGNGS